MPDLEELLREQLRRVTDAVQPGQLRPLRAPEPGPRWRPRLLPVIAAVAVIIIAVTVTSLASGPAGHQLHVTPAPPTAAMPRYYATVAKTSAGLEVVVRDSAHGSVIGTAPLPETQDSVGQSVAAAADGRTFVIAVNAIGASTLPGTAAIQYFRLTVSAASRPGTPVQLAPDLGNAEPLTGMALSPDGTLLALSLMHLGLTTNVQPYGDIEVVNLITGKTRTWAGSGQLGYWPGAPLWENGDRTLTFTWWHTTSQTTGAAVLAGVRQLNTSAPGNNLLASGLNSFQAVIPGLRSAVITAGGRDIIASSCRDVAASGGYHGTAVAQIVELSAADGHLIRVLRTQVTRFPSTTDEQNALNAACAVLSVDPSGNHLLVQAFSFGRIDNGVFTALPGAAPGEFFAAGAW